MSENLTALGENCCQEKLCFIVPHTSLPVSWLMKKLNACSITFRLNFLAMAKVISVPPVLSWCYYLTFYYAIVDFEMASCYSSHSKKFLIELN